MDQQKKSNNKITDIVRLRQMLKKWKKLADGKKITTNKGIKYLKRTLSLSNSSASTSMYNNSTVPKGYLALCVGEEMKRFVIPTEYLSHRAFEMLLREAEEEFGFEQEGVLRIPCDVEVFENILEMVSEEEKDIGYCCTTYSAEAEISLIYHCQEPMCR